MDMNDRSEDPNAQDGRNVAEAKTEVIRFLVGESSDVEGMAAGVKLLARIAPGELSTLRQRVLAEPQDEVCAQFSVSLSEYLKLSAKEALERMPEVYFHARTCRRCSSDVSILTELEELSDEWLALSRRIRKAAEPSLLVLFKQGWKWVTDKLQIAEDLSGADVSRSRQIGAFVLGPPLAIGSIHFADSTQPPLSLCLPHTSDRPQLDIHIVPEHQAFKNRFVWRAQIEMNRGSAIDIAHVGIGDEDQQTTGRRELRGDRSVEFTMAPPTQKNYWLYIQWRSETGEMRLDKIELPLRAE